MSLNWNDDAAVLAEYPAARSQGARQGVTKAVISREIRDRAGRTTLRQILRRPRYQATARRQFACNHTLVLYPTDPYDEVPAFLDDIDDAIAKSEVQRQGRM